MGSCLSRGRLRSGSRFLTLAGPKPGFHRHLRRELADTISPFFSLSLSAFQIKHDHERFLVARKAHLTASSCCSCCLRDRSFPQRDLQPSQACLFMVHTFPTCGASCRQLFPQRLAGCIGFAIFMLPHLPPREKQQPLSDPTWIFVAHVPWGQAVLTCDRRVQGSHLPQPPS